MKPENLFPALHHHPQARRRQALVPGVHLRRRHPAVPHRPARERLRIEYSNYRRFGAESTFTPR